jgi:hypothetical protein
MKKTLAILALVAFLGGIGAPAFANENASLSAIELADKDPKKKETKKEKTEKKSSDCTSEKKSGDCTSEKKSGDCKK